jgi:HAD superfamily hydrolase (TIGR01509 family)
MKKIIKPTILKGIIFDFDGIILETEIPRYNAWRSLFQEYGLPFTIEQWHLGVGTGPSVFDPAVILANQTKGKIEAYQAQVIADERALSFVFQEPILPGVQELIQAAEPSGIKLAVASSSEQEWVLGNLERIGLLTLMDVVCTANDVTKVKPDPELYLLALDKLGLSPENCLAFEDSPNGILAARRAGLRCVAVPTRMTASMDLTAANLIVNSIPDLDLASFPDLQTKIGPRVLW